MASAEFLGSMRTQQSTTLVTKAAAAKLCKKLKQYVFRTNVAPCYHWSRAEKTHDAPSNRASRDQVARGSTSIVGFEQFYRVTICIT